MAYAEFYWGVFEKLGSVDAYLGYRDTVKKAEPRRAERYCDEYV